MFRSAKFRSRLIYGLLFTALIPLALCSFLILQSFRIRTSSREQQQALASADYVRAAFSQITQSDDRLNHAAERIGSSEVLRRALSSEASYYTLVYTELFSATQEIRSYAVADLYDAAGKLVYSTGNQPYRDSLPVDWGILYAAAQAEGQLVLRCPDSSGAADEPALLYSASIHSPEGRLLGYSLFRIYPSGLQDLFRGRLGVQDELLILSPYWRPVFSTSQNLFDSAGDLREQLMNSGTLRDETGVYFYTVCKDEPSGLFFVLRQPHMVSPDTTRQLVVITVLCALGSILLAVWVSLRFSRQMAKPLENLQTAFEQVEHNRLDARVDESGRDEFAQLGRRFNRMAEALSRNQQELVEGERELNQAQLRMLQAQLNPHFLCNTLDTMKWISKINKVPQVAVMSTNLADLLRFCIGPEETVPLRQELQVLQRYVEIQQIRLSDRFEFVLSVPDALMDCSVPKMLLQPIVENAILHGIDTVAEGRITLAAFEEQGMLHICVSDNGPGFSPEMTGRYHGTPSREDSHHLGLYNLNTILQKYYSPEGGLFLENTPEGGASVTAVLPAERGTSHA